MMHFPLEESFGNYLYRQMISSNAFASGVCKTTLNITHQVKKIFEIYPKGYDDYLIEMYFFLKFVANSYPYQKNGLFDQIFCISPLVSEFHTTMITYI